tara:strand:- start:3631 stop:3816 length:186 start_codon:yes stop_codon:yes gene_type:complete
MKLKQLLEQLNQLAKEKPEALEMEVYYDDRYGHSCATGRLNVESVNLICEDSENSLLIKNE